MKATVTPLLQSEVPIADASTVTPTRSSHCAKTRTNYAGDVGSEFQSYREGLGVTLRLGDGGSL